MSTGTERGGSAEPSTSGGASFWIAAVIGAGIIAFGVRGLLAAAPATRPGQVAVSLVGLDLLHDALVAPLACLIGVLLTRWLPPWARAPVRAGLFASAIAVLVGWAALRGYGRDQVPDNRTVDPLDYGSAILTVLAIAWVTAALWAWIAWYRSSRAATAAPPQA